MTEEHRPEAESTGLIEGLPTQRLAQEARNLLEAFAQKALASIGDKVKEKVTETTQHLVSMADEGGPGVKAAVSGIEAIAEGKSPFRAALGAGATGLKEKVKQIFGRGRGKKGLKLINIVESIDVGVPLRLAYDQWTQFEDFPSFMKKVEQAERQSDEVSNWKAQVFWSHRTWESKVLEQVPDDHIIWQSKGAKGHVDGAVSFSELAPNLTRILLVMEYHPQGFFERTGNLWRAPGRRARLEFKHFRRHVMAHAILEPEEIEGWRGEIRDGEVVKTHEDALEEEKRARTGEEPEEEAPEPRAEEAGEEAGEEAEKEPAEGEEAEEEPTEGEEAEGEEQEEEPGPEEEREVAEEPPRPPRARRRPSVEDEERVPRARRRAPAEDEERPVRRRRPAERRVSARRGRAGNEEEPE